MEVALVSSRLTNSLKEVKESLDEGHGHGLVLLEVHATTDMYANDLASLHERSSGESFQG